MSPLNKRRWQNFKQNKRAIYSLLIFSIFFLISIFAEFIANDKPLVIYYNKEFYSQIIKNYSERVFGGEFKTEAEAILREKLNQHYVFLIVPNPSLRS